MSTTTFSYNPISILLPPSLHSRFNSLKPISFLKFPTSKPLSLSPSIPTPSVYKKNTIWDPKTMAELVRVSAFGNRDDVQGFGGTENEAILSGGAGSSRFDVPIQSALNRVSKWLVTLLFGAVILWRHDAEALWAAMGSVLNTLLSLILKRIINQERPFSTSKSDPGMPSSHAQSIFFAVIFSIISMVKFFGLNGATVVVSVLAMASGSYFSWLRVSQKHHTINQVIVGAIVGTFVSIMWFQLWDAVVLNAFNSYLWVRLIVVLGSAVFCIFFTIYVIQHWLEDEQEAL